jgi:translation initiation factor IF-1
MSDSEEKKTAVGIVEEVLPDSLFRVRLSSPSEEGSSSVLPGESEEGKEDAPQAAETGGGGEETPLILAYLAGKMRLHRIRVLVGDHVEMVLDPYGGRARIVRRLT